MATGQWTDPCVRRSIHIPSRSRSPDHPLPCGTSGQAFCRSRPRSGFALPASGATERFLTLIVGRSHLDRRARHNPIFGIGGSFTALTTPFRATLPARRPEQETLAIIGDAGGIDVGVQHLGQWVMATRSKRHPSVQAPRNLVRRSASARRRRISSCRRRNSSSLD